MDSTHKCSLCDKSFSSPQGLGSHKYKMHNIRGTGRKPPKLTTGKILCSICEHHPEFESKNSLGQHYRYEHGGAKRARGKLNGGSSFVPEPSPRASSGVSLEEAIATLKAEVVVKQQVISDLEKLARM